MKINFALRIAVLSFFSFLFCVKTNAQEKTLDAAAIAYNHYNSIVKILLVDSASEKKSAGSGYLGRGSGFFVSDDGLIFTNRHVVKHALGLINYTDYDKENKEFYDKSEIYKPSELGETQHYKINYISKASIIIQVFTNRNGSTSELYVAKIVAIDSTNFDGAILQIVSDLNGNKVQTKFNPLQIANSDSTFQGEDLCLYGFPAQYSGAMDKMLLDQSTLTFGKHSGYDYFFNSDYGYIKTDAAINNGNSGGPVFNRYGKVIGLATSANTKTNTGFISGINGMYYIAQKDTAIGRKLEKLGQKYPPVKNVVKSGIVAYPSVVVPNEKVLKELNLDWKNTRRFKGGFWYFRGAVSLIKKDYYVMEPYPVYGGLSLNTTGKLDVKTLTKKQVEIGRAFSLWRINDKSKISVDWTILNYTRSAINWKNADIVRDTVGGVYTYDEKGANDRFSSKLGVMYSLMIKNRVVVDAYYKIAYVLTEDGEVGSDLLEYSVTSPQVQRLSTKTGLDKENTGVFHCVGFNVRYRMVSLGLEYNFGSQQFMLGNVVLAKWEGEPAHLQYDYKNDLFGKQTVRNLNLTLGVVFGGRKRWKHLKD